MYKLPQLAIILRAGNMEGASVGRRRKYSYSVRGSSAARVCPGRGALRHPRALVRRGAQSLGPVCDRLETSGRPNRPSVRASARPCVRHSHRERSSRRGFFFSSIAISIVIFIVIRHHPRSTGDLSPTSIYAKSSFVILVIRCSPISSGLSPMSIYAALPMFSTAWVYHGLKKLPFSTCGTNRIEPKKNHRMRRAPATSRGR